MHTYARTNLGGARLHVIMGRHRWFAWWDLDWLPECGALENERTPLSSFFALWNLFQRPLLLLLSRHFCSRSEGKEINENTNKTWQPDAHRKAWLDCPDLNFACPPVLWSSKLPSPPFLPSHAPPLF